MSETAQYAFQANFKFGPQYKETLVNVPAQTPEEMLGKLEWLEANAAKFVAAAAALHGVPPELAANVTNTQVQFGGPVPGFQGQPDAAGQFPQQTPPAQQNNSGWGAPPNAAPPPWSQPATTAPSCQHGARVFKEGVGAKGPWKAWFCPSKNRQDQCEAQWVK